MNWFKHDCNARNDIKIKLLKQKFGNEGYAVYFQLLEIVADFANKQNIKEWGFVDKIFTTETLANEVGVTAEKLTEIFTFCNELQLFEQKNGRLFIPKAISRFSEYAQKIKRSRGKNDRTMTGQEPDNDRNTSVKYPPRREKKRKEETTNVESLNIDVEKLGKAVVFDSNPRRGL